MVSSEKGDGDVAKVRRLRRGQPGDSPVPNCDFDADGRSDFTVWTPKTGIFSWIPSASPWLVYQKQWGARFDKALCGDFDGDKRRDFVAYRNWTGEWFILPYSVSSFVITFRWGYSTDLPVTGDYDGDGRGKSLRTSVSIHVHWSN